MSIIPTGIGSTVKTLNKAVADIHRTINTLRNLIQPFFLISCSSGLSFNSLKSYVKDISTLLPDVLKKRLNEVINKIIIIDSIDIGNFDHNIANFLINIFYELDYTKVYSREELEKVWQKCNFELEDYTNEAYSFDLTIDNLIKAGFLINNGASYSVNA